MRLSVKIPKSYSSGEPLSPIGRLFRQSQFNCHIIYILGLGKILTAEQIKAGLMVTVLRHPRFSSIQVTDASGRNKVRWVPTKVNLDEHIVFADTDMAVGDPAAGDLYVENYTSNLSRSNLDFSRPLWDLHILPIRTSEAACVAVFRIHHSIGDGTSLMSLLFACTDKARRRLPAAHYPNLINFLIYVWNTLVDAILFTSSVGFLKDTKTPMMGKEGVEYRPRRFVHRTLCLDDIKAVKNIVGCTINDVLVGVLSAALSRYLSRSYGGLLPKHLRIRTTMAANIRPNPGIIHDLADMMKEDSEVKWGNRFGCFLLRLPVINCQDPLDYVRKGAAITEKKKNSFAAKFTFTSFVLIEKILGSKVGAALLHRLFSNTTLSFSNIIGPIEEVEFCGSPLVYIAPSVYGLPHALIIHVQSYFNKMKVVLSVDEHVIPDPHMFLEDIANSLQIIKDSAASKI